VLIIAGALALVGFTIFTANGAASAGNPHQPRLHLLLRLLIALNAFYALNALTFALTPGVSDTTAEMITVDPQGAFLYVVAALALSAVAWLFAQRDSWRIRFRTILPTGTAYDPASPVHTTAVVLALVFVSVTVGQFVLSGGASGLAANLESSGISLEDVAFNQGLWLVMASLGIGIGLRRTAKASATRLGLAMPTLQGLGVGAIVGTGMVLVSFIFTIIWVMLVTPEQFAAQTAAAAQVSRAFDSIGLAFVLALMVACGEEIFFRGALHPIFGNLLTSLFFVILHTQYILSPATIPIFLTSLALGWVRRRYNTTAAISGHFFFNFIQLALATLGGG